MEKYIKGVDENYSILKQIKISIVISFIILILDILGIPSEVLSRHELPVAMLILFGCILLVGLTLIENGVTDAFKIPSINHFDIFVFISISSILIYEIIIFLLGELYLYKIIIIKLLLILLLFSVCFRSRQYITAVKQSKEYKSNIIDLKDLYEGNIDELKDDIVLLNEEDVDYDLLDRSKVINQLYNAIIMANPDGRFVISLEGKWGSGKTTIIKNVKKMIFENEDNIVVIDEFDPWTYSDEEALLINMFNIIIQKSGFKYSTFFTKRLAEDLSEIVLGTNKKGVIKSIFFQNSAINLKAKINSYLRLSGKKFVFFIDNLDRAEKDNVILLFKLVGNVLDFERVTYVLSFDDKRVKEIFREDLSIDYEYLKKIIQLQIRVPEIDKNVLNKIYDTSLKKLLIIYGESKDNFNEYNPIIDIICRQKLDIRDFKRFINSVLSSSFRINHYLYKRDLLVIEYIRLFNLPLYLTIYDNKQYFVSHDQMFDKDIYYDTFNREEFNSKGKAFFEKIFADIENKVYIDILAELFPYVNKYKIGEELIYTGNIIARDIEYPRISKCKRICSAKYFDLYFTDTNNAFIIIAGLVEKFVEDMNESQSFVDREAVFQNMLKSVHYSYHKEIFERIQLYLEDLEKGCILILSKYYFKRVNALITL